jgi:hypothetical protein
MGKMVTKEQILKANKYGLGGGSGDYYTPILDAAKNLGLDGFDLSNCETVTGYRYGSAPESMLSYNYTDNRMEHGLSLAAINGGKEIGSSVWFCDRDKKEYTGLLLPVKGSDGEPLILCYGAEYLD